MKETIIIVCTIIGSLITLATLIRMIYNMGKKKGKEEKSVEYLGKIDIQLTNHITDLKKDIHLLHDKMDSLITTQNVCRREMEGRVARMEGKFNGFDLRQG